jgi:hypothetical protein
MACSDARDSDRIGVEANELGIATLETDRYQDGDADLYELRALGERGDIVATVTLRVAPDADLAALAPEADNRRADIHVAAAGSELDVWSRAIGRYELRHAEEDAIRVLLGIPEVAATLKRDANILVPSVPATTEVAYTTMSCNPAHLLTTPIAGQCCYEYSQSKYTLQFFNETAHTRIRRERSPDGAGCRGLNGETSCSGAYDASTNPTGCFYGPNAFAVTLSDSIPAARHYMGSDLGPNTGGNYCYAYYYTFQGWRAACSDGECPGGAFESTTGTFPRGWGCLDGIAVAPGGGSTCTQAGCGFWDY